MNNKEKIRKMKSILLSIKPEWVCKILNGDKTIEVRKKFPKDYKGWVYIYCTKDYKNILFKNGGYGWELNTWTKRKNACPVNNAKVVARFWCDDVKEIMLFYDDYLEDYIYQTFDLKQIDLMRASCLTYSELSEYLNKTGYAIHISQLEIFDKPKELWAFEKYGSYTRKDIKCKNKDKGMCNRGWGIKGYSGCEKARLTNAPQNFIYIEGENMYV